VDSARPVGVFDSGVGGLSVLRAIRDELPDERLIYVADSGHAPYGDRAADFIEQRATAVTAFLLSQDAKAVVVACNTVTGAAIDMLRARFSIPIVAIEPAVKPAAAGTTSGVVGVLATTVTLASPNFARLVDRFAGEVTVITQPCPGLVEQVERGDLDGPETRALVGHYVRPLIERGADTLVLGCTHYAFITPLIRDLAGPTVTIVDPATAVAREVRRRLDEAGLLAPDDGERDGVLAHRAGSGHVTFWTSGALDVAAAVLSVLWPGTPPVQALPSAYAVALLTFGDRKERRPDTA
jgi:glutamate racemase